MEVQVKCECGRYLSVCVRTGCNTAAFEVTKKRKKDKNGLARPAILDCQRPQMGGRHGGCSPRAKHSDYEALVPLLIFTPALFALLELSYEG